MSKQKRITASDLKNVEERYKEGTARLIGTGRKIGELIKEIIGFYKERAPFADDLTDEKATSILREALRTCNPNDKKFNVKKYGAFYREGRLSMIQGMGDGLMRAFDKHIRNLNFALEETTFNFREGLSVKEYASITKDLVTAVSLYKEIAEAHQPASESPFDRLPAEDSALLLAEVEAEAAEALPSSEAPKALPEPTKDSES